MRTKPNRDECTKLGGDRVRVRVALAGDDLITAEPLPATARFMRSLLLVICGFGLALLGGTLRAQVILSDSRILPGSPTLFALEKPKPGWSEKIFAQTGLASRMSF